MIGQRARSIPPLRMYLFVSMLFFLSFAFDPPAIEDVHLTVGGEVVGADLIPADAPPSAKKPIEVSLPGPRNLWMPWAGQVADKLPALRRMPPQKLLDQLSRRLQAIVPKVIFLNLPLLALLLTMLYWRRASYLQHLILAVHLQTFLFLVPLPVRCIPSPVWATGYVLAVLFLWTPLYIWRAMARVHAEAWWKSLLRTQVVLLAYALLTALCFYVTIVILVMGIE